MSSRPAVKLTVSGELRAARQEQLIRATNRLIGERGVHLASFREIAQSAGLSKGLIPYYFQTKENLIVATMHWALSETAGRIEQAMATASTPEDKVAAMVDAIFVEPEANRRFHIAYFDLVGHAARGGRYGELRATFDGIVNALNTDLIRAGITQGAFAVDDVEDTAMALRAIVDGLFLQWLQEDDWRGRHPRYRELCKRAILRLLGAQTTHDGGDEPMEGTLAVSKRARTTAGDPASAPSFMNAAEFLLAAGADGKVALQSWDDSITYGALREKVAQAAAVWRSLGLERGDRVLVFGPDSIEWVVAYLGAIWAGGVAVALNSRLYERELLVIFEESESRFVWCDSGSAGRLEQVLELCGKPPLLARSDDFSARVEASKPLPAVHCGAGDPALWIYTSGSTGRPKAVVHAHRMVLGAAEFAAKVLGLSSDASIYASSKLFFAYALGNGLCAGLALGGTVVLDEEWPTAERVAAVIERHAPTAVFSVPTLYLKMLEAGVTPRLGAVQQFVSAGEALPSKLSSEWREATGRSIVNGYGASETVVLVLYCADESGLLRPSPHVELRMPEPPPEPGAPHRLWLRHDSVALGYWRRPEIEHDAFSDGWFSPGDVFQEQASGCWTFCGRDDDLVKISGQWVSTLDVEQALTASCGDTVKELAAISFRNADGLVSIALFAVPAESGEQAAATRLADGIEALPRQRRPREVRWLEELPRTDTGKLRRRVLREQYLEAS